MKCSIFIFLFFSASSTVYAYPDFISYGYKSCLTCHYSAAGGGALNDYGRALFALEITSRPWNPKANDTLGEDSTFMGLKNLPYWLKPALKYRGLWVRSNAFDSSAVERFINMQVDGTVTIPLDKKGKYLLSGTIGYQETPQRFKNTSSAGTPAQWISREYYFRWQIAKSFFLYAGFLDKIFGLKHPDHSAFNRSNLGLGQNDQSHGALLFWSNNLLTIGLQGFVGNLNQSSDLLQKGGSLFTELEVADQRVVGLSVLSSKGQFIDEQRYALHSRVGISKGHSLIVETGFKVDAPKNAVRTVGWYNYMQTLMSWKQGYNFLGTFQTYNDKTGSDSKSIYKLGTGVLLYPIANTEIRAELVNSRSISTEEANPDTWVAQGQVHFSW